MPATEKNKKKNTTVSNISNTYNESVFAPQLKKTEPNATTKYNVIRKSTMRKTIKLLSPMKQNEIKRSQIQHKIKKKYI